MKDKTLSYNKEGIPLEAKANQKKAPTIGLLQKERQTLLDLGNDITKVRGKNDLLTLFSKRIKGLFYFTHTIVTLIDEKSQTYFPFLLDDVASPIKGHAVYAELIKSYFPLKEPFIQTVLAAGAPIPFLLEDIMDKPQSPLFLKANHDAGVRVIMMASLTNADKPIGFIHIYSDKIDSFTDEFRNIIKGILPQLSSAVSNIIKNEEILKKESEKSMLLEFSREITTVKNKKGLDTAVRTAIAKVNPVKGYVIQRINDDDGTTCTYIHDETVTSPDDAMILEVEATRFPINDGLQNRVLESYIPLLIGVDMEIRRGITSKYLFFWKKMDFKTMVGIALRNGDKKFGILWLVSDEINIQLLQGIAAQISTAMANIIAHEEVIKKEREQSFLLDFSNDIAGTRSKVDLESAIAKVLQQMLNTKLAMIQVIGDDGFNLTPFMFDKTLFQNVIRDFDELKDEKINIKEYYTNLVLKSREAVVFNVAEELRNGNAFAVLWNKTGFKNMYASALRVGNKNLGTLWMLADGISQRVFKGICAQISTAVANILANEKILLYRKQLEQENDYLKEQIRTIYNFSEIIGTGEQMQDVYHLMSLVAPSNSTVLILGETGTGKELIARAIHNASPRKDKLMIKVNCAAMPANLIESELFGHERGAFTGAIDRRIGKFELANNSTLFLDEIGEMPLEAQVKLLRVIQERELERVGGKNTIKVDVRIIAATNRDLEEEIKEGRFRSDMFYRLNVFPITLPPLRERVEDIPLLANFFLSKFSKNTGRKVDRVSPKVMQQLRTYPWPGNVRELEHLMERSILMASDNLLREIYLPKQTEDSKQKKEIPANRTLEEMERTYIIDVLKKCNGKISGAGGAAEILDVPGNTLHSKMKKLAIGKADYFGK